jgi:7,8-dihydropterin-6-yl-methyl-4-(beta-D-ribofuranosyl)aminobenzene 5'-phosphate synthase
MNSDYEEVDKNLFVRKEGILEQDILADDLAVVIDADFGLVIVVGCAHRGIVNTINYAQKLTGNKRVYAVIGGIHLFRASEERITKTINDLKKIGVQKVVVSHCTGFNASTRLAQEFGERFFMNNAGNRITLP